MMSKIIELETQKITVAVTSGEFLAAQAKRDFLHVRNDSANTVYIRFGSTAAVADATSIKMVSGSELTFHTPGVGPIQAIALTGNSDVTVTTNVVATP